MMNTVTNENWRQLNTKTKRPCTERNHTTTLNSNRLQEAEDTEIHMKVIWHLLYEINPS